MDTLNTKIRFWNGLRTIGGTIVSVEYGKSRIIFDFGLNYSPAESFSAIVKVRYNVMVEDYINLGKIPPIDGLYSIKDLGNLINILPAEEDDRTTAVVISHIHLDHIGAMGFIAPPIPVYLTEDSLRIYNALNEVGEGVLGERDYSTCRYDEILNVGDIKVTPIQLDHDVIGACGFLIETPDIRLVYSGDLRLHGKHPERTMDFITKAYIFKPDLLLMEGTMINGDKESKSVKASNDLKGITTEEEVIETMKVKMKKNSGLVIVNTSERNLERIIDIIEAAKELDRIAVLEPETAYLIDKLTDKRNFIIYISKELKAAIEENRAPEWVRRIIKEYKTISSNEINLSPGKYILQNSFEYLMELLDLNLIFSVYIHSNAVPLGAYDPDWEKLMEFLKKLKLEYVYIGASGHAFHSHLKYMINEIKPQILIPLHSFYPEKLYPESKIQFLPEYGVEYILKNNKLIKLTVK